MTNRRNKFYQIGFFALAFAFITLCAYMGITAVQKTMKLNISIPSNPTFLVKVGYNLDGSNNYIDVFCNSELGGGVAVGENVTLSGNKLTLNNLTLSGVGETIYFKITNYTTAPEGMNIAKVLVGGEGSGITQVSKTVAPYDGTAQELKFCVQAPTQTNTVTIPINFQWMSAYTVTFNANGGNFSSGLDTATFEGQTSLPTTDIPIPTRANYTFAGYYKTGNTFEATTIPSADLRYYSNDYLGNTGITPENKELTEDTTLYARWLPFIIGDYYTNTSQVTTSLTPKNGTAMTIGEIWKGYKYIQFENHETQESNYGNYSSRYIIIGAGNNLRDKLFDSTKADFDFKGGKCKTAVTKSAYTDTYYLTGPNTNPNNELQDNQILLLSEATLISQAFDSSSALWQSADGSEKSDINNYLNTTFLTNSGLSAYAGENSYILTTNLNTAWSPNSDSESTAKISSSTQIFLMASKYGYTSATEARGKAISEYGQTKDLTTYTEQNFCVEDYLGDYIRYYSTTYYHNNPRIFTFDGASTYYWWLRSGNYDDSDLAYYVTYYGYINYNLVYDSYGVRPSFCLNLA